LIGHVVPEAAEGMPIAIVEDGDTITIDAGKRLLDLDVSESELVERRKRWVSKPGVERGTLGKYKRNVKDASQGCITDAP